MAPHSSVIAWRIPGTGEPGGLLSLGSHRVRHDWSDLAAAAAARAEYSWDWAIARGGEAALQEREAVFTCWSPQPHRGVFWPSFYLLVGIAALRESLNTPWRCFVALSKVGFEAGGRVFWAEASVSAGAFWKLVSRMTCFYTIFFFFFFLFKRKRPSVKRETGIDNVFRVDFVHCAKWLKQIEKENRILLAKLFQEYTVLKIQIKSVVRNLLTLPG